MGVLRLAHVDVRTPDLELSTAYYTQVLGLQLAGRDEDSVYLKGWDEEDHHSLRLRYDNRIGMDLFSFRVEREDDLHDLEKRLEKAGCHVQRLSKGDYRRARASRSGSRCRPARRWSSSGTWRRPATSSASSTPPRCRRRTSPGSPRPGWTTCSSTRRRSARPTAFFKEVLGFRMTEQVLDANGHQLGVWMERSHSPHDVAIVNGPNGALHHFAFWLDDWDHVRKAADILAYNGVQIDQGPTRHGVTRGNTIYFFDPLGIRNEVFTGGYSPDPDFPAITWSEDQFGRGLFYYENVVAQRFLRFHT